MKIIRKITKYTAILLMLNILFVFSNFCYGLFTGEMQSMNTVVSSSQQVAMSGCGEETNPDLPTYSSNSNNSNAILPCCIGQNNQVVSTVALEKIQHSKQLAFSTVLTMPVFEKNNFQYSSHLYLIHSPPGQAELESIVIRV